jgi:hypothetical protein
LIRFFDAERRRIAARPRSIEIGGDFICPTDRQDGWTALQDKIRKGEDLGPHMSKLHSSLAGCGKTKSGEPGAFLEMLFLAFKSRKKDPQEGGC